MFKRTRILFLIPHLGGGGAEQVTLLLAQNLCLLGYETHIGLVTQALADLSAAPRGVILHGLGATRVRAGALPLLKLVRQLQPDVILSGMAHLNFLVLLLKPLFPRSVRVLIRQNSTASSALAFGALPWYTDLLYRHLYRSADRILCQTNAMARDLETLLATRAEVGNVCAAGSVHSMITVLPNPVDVDAVRAEAARSISPWQGPGPHLLAVGRLSREKGFDLLLYALLEVRKESPSADLTIVGAGREEARLRSLAADLGVAPAVRFTGHVDSPATFFSGATAYVLSSRHEGLPNALLEAAAAGLPIVALPSSAGVTELLRGQPAVWLANDISAEALSDALIEALRQIQTGQRFPHNFIEDFRTEHSVRMLQQLIEAELAVGRAGRPQ